MVKDSLRAHQIQSVVTTGDTVVEFVEQLKSKLNDMTLGCQLTQLDVATIENELEASAPPGVFGPVVESERGWLGRERVLVINDCINSGPN
eukprot:11163126-Lingulodinium_polyedra.AAC.1